MGVVVEGPHGSYYPSPAGEVVACYEQVAVEGVGYDLAAGNLVGCDLVTPLGAPEGAVRGVVEARVCWTKTSCQVRRSGSGHLKVCLVEAGVALPLLKAASFLQVPQGVEPHRMKPFCQCYN
jgi:hypothetical protein